MYTFFVQIRQAYFFCPNPRIQKMKDPVTGREFQNLKSDHVHLGNTVSKKALGFKRFLPGQHNKKVHLFWATTMRTYSKWASAIRTNELPTRTK